MSRRLKVAEVVSSLALGGAERCALGLVSGLDRTRFEPVLLVAGSSGEGPLRSEAASRGVQIRHIRFGSLRNPAEDAALLRELFRYDVVHVHNRPVDYQVAALLRLPSLAGLGPRFFWTWHLPYPHDTAGAALSYRRAAGVARKVVACAPVVERHLKQKLGIPAGKILTLTNGVDTERFRPPELAERKRLQKEYGAGDSVILFSSGRLAPQKGYDRLLSAAALLNTRDDVPPWQLWIAGDGPERDRLAELVPGLRLEERVKLLGPRGDVDQLLRAADIFVLLSRFEGLPLALLEALSTGLPAVTTGIDAFTSLEFSRAVRCLEDSSEEITIATDAADVLAGLIANSEERAMMGSLARHEVSERFSLGRWIEEHEQLYLDQG